MDSRGAIGANTLRGKRTGSHTSSAASSKSRHGSNSEAPPQSPKVLTSFPSFSPPSSASPRRKRSSRETSRLASDVQSSGLGESQSSVQTAMKSAMPSDSPGDKPSSGPKSTEPTSSLSRKPGSSITRTLKGAASLHKSILASLTFSTAAEEALDEGVFEDPDWDAPDPLEHATDEQIQRVIDRNGGAIPSLRQYSKDLAESNARVAQERNNKLELIERNRNLRDQNEQLKAQLEDMQRKYKNVQNLFKRYVRPEHPGQIQIVDSPNGHYILDSTTGDMVEAGKPAKRSIAPSVRTVASAASSTIEELPPKPAPQDATSSLKQLTTRNRLSKDSRKSRGSVSIRPDSLELTTAIDVETLPPALQGDSVDNSAAPVDRLGFFFTTSREMRQQEALVFQSGEMSESSSVNSFPFSDDEFDLKTPNSQDDGSSITVAVDGNSDGELLCYAPVGPAVRFVSSPDRGVRMFIDVSTPSTPTTQGITVSNVDGSNQSSATVAQTSASGTMVTSKNASDSANALGALLERLNEAHDKQQESRMVEWTAFHNHLRSNIPKSLSRASSDYGMANISRLCSKGTVSAETLKKFNTLILSGIPVALRREVWLERTGANTLVEPGRFSTLITDSAISPQVRNEIAADVDRTLGNNVFFRNGVGKTKLEDILIAYAQYNPIIGYSQGLNIIAANLLLMLPSAEDAFWLLVATIENILPHEYYHQDGRISGENLDIDGKVLTSYVADLLGNQLHKHLRIHAVDLNMFTPGWFISAFAACLSGEPLYRIWDILFGFCDGRYMFCFALALLKINRRGLLSCETSEDLMLYLGGKMTNAAVALDVLIKEGVRFGNYVTGADLEKRRKQFAEG